jgi:hypothetical protein
VRRDEVMMLSSLYQCLAGCQLRMPIAVRWPRPLLLSG